MNRTRLSLVLVLLLALAVGCAQRTSAPGSVGTGVRGQVLLGPTCPVETAEHPCPDKPIAATVVAARTDGREAGRVTSGNDGRFTLALAPGHYVLTVIGLDGPRFAKPLDVDVPSSGFVEVTVSVDSGIR